MKNRCTIGEYCFNHRFIHGAEAEELRSKIEALHDLGRQVSSDELLRVLEETDARDSLAWLETVKGAS